jgi:hypothetical protein
MKLFLKGDHPYDKNKVINTLLWFLAVIHHGFVK